MTGFSRLLICTLLLSAWLGAAILTVAVVTPGAFAVLPSRSLAGSMIGRVLPAVFASGLFVTGVVAFLTATRKTSVGAMSTALLAAGACGVTLFGIVPRLDRLRADMGGPVERLASDDPRRVAFGLLHGYSVAGLGVAMLAALIALTFVLFALRPRS